LTSHDAQREPQHGTSVPFARQVPFGHEVPLGGEYPLDWQYPASAPPLDEELDEQATAARLAMATASRERAALMPGPCLIPGPLSRLIKW